MSIHLLTRRAGDVTVIDVDGKITAGEGCIALRSAIRELVRTGNKKILLNLADVSYLDSSGIGELVGAVSRLICAKCNTHFSRVEYEVCPKCYSAVEPHNVRIARCDGPYQPPWGELKILNLTRKMQDLFVITGLITKFEIYGDESSALQSFS